METPNTPEFQLWILRIVTSVSSITAWVIKSPVSCPDSSSIWLKEAVKSRGGLLGTKLLPAVAATEVKYSEAKVYLFPSLATIYAYCGAKYWTPSFMTLWESPPQDIQEVKSELFSLAIFHRKWYANSEDKVQFRNSWSNFLCPTNWNYNSPSVKVVDGSIWTVLYSTCLLKKKKGSFLSAINIPAPVQYHKTDAVPLRKKHSASPFNTLTVCANTAPPKVEVNPSCR